MDYSNIPVAKATFVYGTNVADLDEAGCIRLIKALNAEVKDLKETAEITQSTLLAQRITERGAALNEIVAKLDGFAAPTA